MPREIRLIVGCPVAATGVCIVQITMFCACSIQEANYQRTGEAGKRSCLLLNSVGHFGAGRMAAWLLINSSLLMVQSASRLRTRRMRARYVIAHLRLQIRRQNLAQAT